MSRSIGDELARNCKRVAVKIRTLVDECVVVYEICVREVALRRRGRNHGATATAASSKSKKSCRRHRHEYGISNRVPVHALLLGDLTFITRIRSESSPELAGIHSS